MRFIYRKICGVLPCKTTQTNRYKGKKMSTEKKIGWWGRKLRQLRRKAFNWALTAKDEEERNEYIDSALNAAVQDAKEESNYLKYAMHEFDHAWGEDWKTDESQMAVCNDVLECLAIISRQGHSGFSFGYFFHLLKNVSNFEPITKLTFKEDEFGDEDCFEKNGYGVYQNARLSSVFMHKRPFLNGEPTPDDVFFTYLNGYYIQEDYKVVCDIDNRNFTFDEAPHHFTYHGGFLLLTKNNEFKWVHGAVIKDTATFNKEKQFNIPIYSIGIPKMNWELFLAFEQDCEEFLQCYDFEKEDEYDLYEDTKITINGELKDFSALVEHMVDMVCAEREGSVRPGLWDESEFDKSMEEAVREQVNEEFDQEIEEAVNEAVNGEDAPYPPKEVKKRVYKTRRKTSAKKKKE